MPAADLPRWSGRHELAARLIADPVEATLVWSACCWLPPPGVDPFVPDPDFATLHLGDLPGFRHQDAGTHPEVQRHVERVMRAEDERLLTDPGEEVLHRGERPSFLQLIEEHERRLAGAARLGGWLPPGYELRYNREPIKSEYVGRWPVKEESMSRPAQPCELATEQVDWGNYCPLDPHGVHHCTRERGQNHGDQHACGCGALKPVAVPFPPVGSGVPWRADS